MNEKLQRDAGKVAARKRGKVLRRVIWGVVGVVAVALVVVAAIPKPLQVEVAPVVSGTMVVTLDEVGKTRVRDRYVVSAPLAGNLARLELDPGDALKPGTVLARIAPMDAPMLDARSRAQADARVLQARAALSQAKTAVTRAELAREKARGDADQSRRLAKSGSISDEALEGAVLAVRMREAEHASAVFAAQMAEYEARQAEATLARFAPGGGKDQVEVVSPIAGRVLRVIQESAGVVQPGTPLLEIGDPAALEIVTEVLTADAVSITPGARALVVGWGGAPLEAAVRLVEPAAFSRVSALGVEEQRVRVVLDLRADREKYAPLGDSFRVEVRITTWEGKDVVQVPSSAVFRRAPGWAAYVVRDGRATLREVTVGKHGGREVQITGGLEKGERVIVHPGDRVAEGTRVTAR